MKKLLILALLLTVSTGATTSKRFYHVKVRMQVNNYKVVETIMVKANSQSQARTTAIEMARRKMNVQVLQVKPDKP